MFLHCGPSVRFACDCGTGTVMGMNGFFSLFFSFRWNLKSWESKV